MSNLASYLDCLFPHLDPRLRDCFNDKETDSLCSDDSFTDDDDSDYDESSIAYDDDDDEAEPLQQVKQNASEAQDVLNRVATSNLLKGLEGRANAFQTIMRRGMTETAPNSTIMQETPSKNDQPQANKPDEVLREILQTMGCRAEFRSYETLLQDYFVQPTPEQIAGYDMELMTAVRAGDLNTIRGFYAAGRDLQCCNQFGESILHTVARRGHTSLMKFLLLEANLSLKVCCESGRNPLHDACWTSSPSFDCIRLILADSPDFLLIRDNRNFTPMDYIPKDAWAKWETFFQENTKILRPRVLV